MSKCRIQAVVTHQRWSVGKLEAAAHQNPHEMLTHAQTQVGARARGQSSIMSLILLMSSFIKSMLWMQADGSYRGP